MHRNRRRYRLAHVPPRWSYMNQLWKPLWDTLAIATLGTLLAIIVAVPVAFLAARNTTPSACSCARSRC
jgi:ABC-type phosphate/phosphonate transport system permease subunit